MMDLKTKDKIADIVGDAYDIGHCHGMNPFRMLNGEDPKRVKEGWMKYADRIINLIEEK